MKAISVHNPWAHYVICGEKTELFRNRNKLVVNEHSIVREMVDAIYRVVVNDSFLEETVTCYRAGIKPHMSSA